MPAFGPDATRLESDRFFDLSLDLLSVTGCDGYFKKLNPAWERVLGISIDELLAAPSVTFLHPDDVRRTKAIREEMRAGKHVTSFENRYRCKDGSYRWIYWTGTYDAQAGSIYCVGRDVTDRKQMEAALSATEERYRHVFDANPNPMWVYDYDTLAFVAVNAAAVRHYGYSQSEFLNMSIRDIRPSEDVAMTEVAAARARIEEVNRYDGRHRKKDDSLISVEITSTPVVWEGRPARLVLSVDVTERKRAQESLMRSEATLATAQRIAHLGSWDFDVRTGQNSWSDELFAIYGIEPGSVELTYDYVHNRTHPDDVDMLDRAVADSRAQGHPFSLDLRILWPDGTERWIQSMGQWEFDDAGEPMRIFGTALDITERKRADFERRKSEAGLASAQHLAHMGSWESNLLTGVVVASDEFYTIYGLDREHDVIRRETLWAFDHPDDLPTIRKAVADGMRDRRRYELDHRIIRRDGSVRWVHEQGEFTFDQFARPVAAVGAVLDITDRKEAEERLAFLAHHDALTNLPNRMLLAQRLAQSIAHALDNGRNTAVLFVDLDRFKDVNDTLGHRIGDLVLKGVAARLAVSVRTRDTVARTGGDEFIIVADDVASADDAGDIAAKIVAAFAEPFRIVDEDLLITASVGFSVCPQDGLEPDALIRNADAAMYRAKDQGRNRYQSFTADMHSAALERLHIEKKLRNALQEDEFELFYQPSVDLSSGTIVAGEALLRWRDPEKGLVAPIDFIKVAEETGLILPIGSWVLREGARQAKEWATAGTPCRVSVNVSGRQLRDASFLDEVWRAIADAGVDPTLIGIEVTESAALGDPEVARDVLGECRRLGMDILLDDFGTHYSSLTYLKKLPIDVIKIDRSFVSGLPAELDDAAIVTSVIGLSESLRCRVIAEGVEREDQALWLRAHGCKFAMGYRYARPMPAAEFGALLAARSSLGAG